jgi:hypothetical protein
LVPGHLAAQTDLGPAAKVAGSYIRNHELSSKGWPTIGLDYAETRRSKLTQTNDANVKELGLAWSYNLESTRGIEATPLVVDGVIMRRRPEASCTPSTCARKNACGSMTRKCRARLAIRAAAMSSIAASPYPRVRSMTAD